MSKSGVAMEIDDADGSFFGGRARSYRGRGASPVEGNEFFLSSRQTKSPSAHTSDKRSNPIFFIRIRPL